MWCAQKPLHRYMGIIVADSSIARHLILGSHPVPEAAIKLWVHSIFLGKPNSENLKVSTPKLTYFKWVSRFLSRTCRTSYPLPAFLDFPVYLLNFPIVSSITAALPLFLASHIFPVMDHLLPLTLLVSSLSCRPVDSSIKVSIFFISLFQNSYWDWALPSQHWRWWLTAWLTERRHWAAGRTCWTLVIPYQMKRPEENQTILRTCSDSSDLWNHASTP